MVFANVNFDLLRQLLKSLLEPVEYLKSSFILRVLKIFKLRNLHTGLLCIVTELTPATSCVVSTPVRRQSFPAGFTESAIWAVLYLSGNQDYGCLENPKNLPEPALD